MYIYVNIKHITIAGFLMVLEVKTHTGVVFWPRQITEELLNLVKQNKL